MTKLYYYIFLTLPAFFGAGESPLHAQIQITYPINNQVMQRDSTGNATIPVTAYCYSPYFQIKAFLIPVDGNSHAQKEVIFTRNQMEEGVLTTSIKAETGWYELRVIGSVANASTDTSIVARVGVGEVFLVAGNSNAMGLPGLGAKDASGQVVSFNAINKNLNAENITVAPDGPMPAGSFEVLKKEHYIFPNGETSWYWGELGDMLSKRWNTPVLFFNAAWAAANSENYRDAATGKDAFNLYVGKFWPNRQPYSNIVNTVRYFTSQTGIRAVFWSHGENDAQLNFKEGDYFNHIKTLIENSRKDSGYNITWLVARNSVSNRIPKPHLPIINAQNRLIGIKKFNVFAGPDLDTIQIPRPSSEHFENVAGGIQGLTLAANAWSRSLSDSMVKKLVAIQPKQFIHCGITPMTAFAGAKFSIPYQVARNFSGSPTVQAELLNAAGNYVATIGTGTFSPLAVTIPNDIQNGTFRIRLVALDPVLPGSISDSIYIDNAEKNIGYASHIAASLQNQKINVSWVISAAPTIARVILQKTTNGYDYADIVNFEVPGDGSRVYGYPDNNTGENAIFYRIKMEHRDGSTAFSPIVTIFQNGGPEDFVVFPNPVTRQQFYLKLNSGPSPKCSLFDISGREHPIRISDREAISLLSIRPIYQLPAGKYILRINSDSEVVIQNIVVN